MTTRSANIDFFAVEADQRVVLDFIFAETDLRVFESYSVPDSELREFKTTDELAEALELGLDPKGNGCAVLLQLWSPSVMRTPDIVRINLNPEVCNGSTFRYCIEGGGLIQLYLGGLCAQTITRSHLGPQSQIRAEAWGVADGVDWPELKVLSNRIQYHFRKRLAKTKSGSSLVLPQAVEYTRRGYVLTPAP